MTVYPVIFKKRSGSTLRDYNINVVIGMLKQGMNDKDILTLLAMSFCQDTRIDYLNTAKEKLEMENGNSSIDAGKDKLPDGLKLNPNGEPDAESLLAYAKKHPHKNNEGKESKANVSESKNYSNDLDYWIKTYNYQSLSVNELIEKINQLTNEELKSNWLKQVESSKEGEK